MENDILNLFNKNFDFVIRENNKVKDILENKENKIFRKYIDNNLAGASVINKNTIIFICVDKPYRNKGIGSGLLEESEKYIKNQRYNEIFIGAGYDYIMPGVPTNKKVISENLSEENINPSVNGNAKIFFEKRGYYHFWDCNCFDMKMDMQDYTHININENNITDGIIYSFANKTDIDNIIKCTDDAHKEFSKYYKDENLYNGKTSQNVMIAKKNDEVVGTLIISNQTEGENIGSVGCTTVKHNYRGKHIGVNLVSYGTNYLYKMGLKTGFLGYTYSGLDKMYGYSGYKICCYYFMAKKDLLIKK